MKRELIIRKIIIRMIICWYVRILFSLFYKFTFKFYIMQEN